MTMKRLYLLLGNLLVLNLLAISLNAQSLSNIAPDATVEASYTAGWNALSSINNGVVGYGPAGGGTPVLGNLETWATWSDSRPESQWLSYYWETSKDINQVTVYFWADVDNEAAGDGVALPLIWTIQYWSEADQNWVDVVPVDGQDYTNEISAPNSIEFNTVNTNSLRLFMYTRTDGVSYAAVGVTEWEVYPVISDPTVVARLNELQTQQENLDLGDLSYVTDDLVLPTELGDMGVTCSWVSNNTAVLGNDGTVTQPEKYDTKVLLTATLEIMIDTVSYTIDKEFTVTIPAINPVIGLLAHWDFSSEDLNFDGDTIRVNDDSESGFVGKLVGDSKIRTIGETDQYNVLELGNSQGYFDMGQDIGEAIYSLTDFSIGAFFRIDTSYTDLDLWGNVLWGFSNSADVSAEKLGTMYATLSRQNAIITPTSYHDGSEQGPWVWQNAPKGGWHHFAYVQEGTVGSIYVDGVFAISAEVTHNPAKSLRKDGMRGTTWNTIGRPVYPGDAYLRKTLVYGFELYNVVLSPDDMIDLGYVDMLETLDAAYAENEDYQPSELVDEKEALDLGDLSNVVADLTLPVQGSLTPEIEVIWSSSHPQVISTAGVVTKPEFYPQDVVLTATLALNGQTTTKQFTATVPAEDNSEFKEHLLVNFDFNTVNGRDVVDAAEKHFSGKLMNDASIRTIGLEDNQYKVLDLGDSIGYFDMGERIGRVMYNLNDYTISCFYRINENYENINAWGNYIWNFSNMTDAVLEPNGYFISFLKNQSIFLTPENYNKEEGITLSLNASIGGWHNLVYTQKDSITSMYVDGVLVGSDTIYAVPANTLPKAGLMGTPYNWIGRSCYVNDAYLRQTLVNDFQIYDIALSEEEIVSNSEKIASLDAAYELFVSNKSLTKPAVEDYQIRIQNKKLIINGINALDKVSVYNLSGQQITNTYRDGITLNPGIYIIRINNSVKKISVY